MQRYGMRIDVLTDNGRQFKADSQTPRPGEVMFERIWAPLL
jgi:hypothetical protein